MSIFTVIGDPHAKPDNLGKIETLFNIVEDLGNPTIWLGDMLDTKELVRGRCLNTYLELFSASKLQHYVLVGNHDWFNLECRDHSLHALALLPNVKVIASLHREGNLVFLPYVHDSETFKMYLNECTGKDVVFCHADIKGFDYGNGLLSTNGIEASECGAVKRVISGHYHKYQEEGNITYLGTPFSHSFGETDQEKFIGLYDSKKNALELLPTPFPKHVTYEIDCSKELGLKHVDTTNIPRYVLTGTTEEIKRFSKVKGVKFIERPTAIMKKSKGVNELQSPELQFKSWSKNRKLTKDTEQLGLEVLKSVL